MQQLKRFWIVALLWMATFICAAEILPAGHDFAEWDDSFDSSNLKYWQDASSFPVHWSPLDRKDRANKISRSDGGGIKLDGMIRSERFHLPPNSHLEFKITADSEKGSLNVFLFQYFNKEDKYFQQTGYVMRHENRPIHGEYTEQIQMGGQRQEWVEVVLDGTDVMVKDIRLRVLEKTAKKISPPIFHIPLITTSPAEWKSSLSLVNPFRSVTKKNTILSNEKLYLHADREAWYLLLKTPERLVSRSTCDKRDSAVYLDDSLEIIVRPEETTDRLFHVVVNFKGVIFDEEKAVGQNFVDWNCSGIQVNTNQEPGYKTLAVKIPFTSLNIKNPELGWYFNICRNYPELGENGSLNGEGYFSIPDMAQGKVSTQSSQVSFSSNRSETNYHLAMTASEKYFWQVKELGGSSFEKSIMTDNSSIIIAGDKNDNRTRAFESILKNGSEIILRNTVRFPGKEETTNKEISGKKISEFKYYPIQKKAAVILRDLSFREQKEIDKVSCRITFAGKETAELVFPDQKMIGNTAFSAIPFEVPCDGEYDYEIMVFQKNGQLKEKNSGKFHAKKDFSWVGNNYGKERIVIPPFTDLAVIDRTVSCSLRDYQFDATGFPRQILARGEKLLAGPVTLNIVTADGNTLEFKGTSFRFTATAQDRVEFESELDCNGLRAVLSAWMEYDGLVFYTMTLHAASPVKVKRMYLAIPYENASHLHVAGPGIRSAKPNFQRTSELAGDGVIWQSSEYLPIRSISGSFLANVWLGNLKHGLSFFAESDAGWINTRRSSCYDLVRTSNGKLELRVNFVAKEALLAGKRTISFGLMANPFKEKKIHAGADLMVDWQTTFSRLFFNIGLLPIDDFISSLMINKEQKASYLPYTCGNEYVYGDPEFKAVATELDRELNPGYNNWETSLSRRTGGMDNDDYMSRHTLWNKYRVDFMIWRMYHLMKNLPVDGVYLDNSYVQYSDNPLTVDQGFFKEDGSLQARFNILAERDFLKRVAVMNYLYKKRFPGIVVHCTGSMLPSFAFADLAIDGEMDIADTHYEIFYPAWNEIMLAADWGLIPGRLTMLNGKVNPRKNAALFSMFKLYDMKFWITHSGFDMQLYQRLREVERKFGVTAPDCRFTGYWQDTGIIFSDNNKDVLASCYTRPQGKLIYMTNQAADEKEISFKLPENGILTDILGGRVIRPANNVYTVKIKPRNFLLLQYSN